MNQYNFQQIGFRLLGQHIKIDYTALQGYNTLDCSYLIVLLQCGVLGSVVFLTGYTLVLYKTITKKEYTLLAVTILILLAGITENTAIDIVSAFPLIYLADLDGTYTTYIRRKT